MTGMRRIEVAWGLYLFSLCILTSCILTPVWVGLRTEQRENPL